MYQLIRDSDCIQRLADGAVIPPDEGNTDYRDYLAWVDAGNTARPADPPPALPPAVVANIEHEGEALANTMLRSMVSMTYTQRAAWIDTNFPSPAYTQVQRNALGALAHGVALVLRHIFASKLD